jgi:formate hydrogenlyase subunit 3/multisubunit Na+/H+ antiporter MnhD subunit
VVQHHAEVRRVFMVLFAMANTGLPGTSGFVGEFMVILGAVKARLLVGAAAATTLILGAAYTLWMVKRVVFGAVANHHVAELSDIGAREFVVLGLLALCVLGMGLYPFPLHGSDARFGGQPAEARRRPQVLSPQRMINFAMPDLYPASAEIFLLIMACAVLLIDLFSGKDRVGSATCSPS